MFRKKATQQPELVAEPANIQELLELKELKDSSPLAGLIHPGITLIDSSMLGFPVYIALKISDGSHAFGIFPTIQSQVRYCCSTSPVNECLEMIEAVSVQSMEEIGCGCGEHHNDLFIPDELKFYVNYEMIFWSNPLKLLSLEEDLKCLFVEITDKSLFESRRTEIKQLETAAKQVGISVVLVCSWGLEHEMTHDVIRVQSGASGSFLTVKKVGGAILSVPLQWVDEELDYRLPTFNAYSDWESMIPYYRHLGLSKVQIMRLLEEWDF